MKTGRLIALILCFLPYCAYVQAPALDVYVGTLYQQRLRGHPNIQDAYILHPGYAVGVGYQHPVGKKFSVRGGLRILSMSQKTREEEVGWGTQIDPDTGLPKPGVILDRMQSIYHDRYIEVPFWVRYNFNSSKLSAFVELGIANSLYVNTENVTFTNGQESSRDIAKDNFRRPFTSSAQAGLGVSYTVDKRWGVFLQPYFQRSFTTLSKLWGPYPVSIHVYGINVGSSFYLN